MKTGRIKALQKARPGSHGTSITCATKYIVYSYANNKYTAYKMVTSNYCVVTDLTNCTKYDYRVRAYVNGAWTVYNIYDITYATPQKRSMQERATFSRTELPSSSCAVAVEEAMK